MPYFSNLGQSKHQMWIQLCQLLSENPNKITSIKVEPIIRQGLLRFTDMTGYNIDCTRFCIKYYFYLLSTEVYNLGYRRSLTLLWTKNKII